jgi:uncharacterized protein YbjT (DUF2867 family)
MKLLLTGASGFIGSRLREALLGAGHELVCIGSPGHAGDRGVVRCRWVDLDFAADSPPPWARHLLGVDAVVNTVGIFRECRDRSFAAVHTAGPIALFDACVVAGVARVLQLSALGADAAAPTAFLRSKHAADEHLLALPLDATVLQPSLVFGAEGPSSRRLLTLASLPLLPLPAGGQQLLQPVHVDDVVAALRALLEAPPGRWRARRMALVGPDPISLRAYLFALRHGLGLGPAPAFTVPRALMALAAGVGEHLPGALFDRSAWRMLERGNTASAAGITSLLGKPPRPAGEFIARGDAAALRTQSQLGWLLPLLRCSLAAVWILTGIVSFGLYPTTDSEALLARAGVAEALRPLALYGAATLDLALGVLTLWPLRRRRWLWLAQAALILGYTVVISWRLPEYWLHPYGPISKNLPLLALLWLLWALDRGADTHRAPDAEAARWTT